MNRSTGNTVIIPMDHGVTAGPIKGIKSLKKMADLVASGGADAAIVHKGQLYSAMEGTVEIWDLS